MTSAHLSLSFLTSNWGNRKRIDLGFQTLSVSSRVWSVIQINKGCDFVAKVSYRIDRANA